MTALMTYVEHHPLWTWIFMTTFFVGVYFTGIGWKRLK